MYIQRDCNIYTSSMIWLYACVCVCVCICLFGILAWFNVQSFRYIDVLSCLGSCFVSASFRLLLLLLLFFSCCFERCALFMAAANRSTGMIICYFMERICGICCRFTMDSEKNQIIAWYADLFFPSMYVVSTVWTFSIQQDPLDMNHFRKKESR